MDIKNNVGLPPTQWVRPVGKGGSHSYQNALVTFMTGKVDEHSVLKMEWQKSVMG